MSLVGAEGHRQGKAEYHDNFMKFIDKRNKITPALYFKMFSFFKSTCVDSALWYVLSFVLNNIIFKRISGILPTTFTFMGEKSIQNTSHYTFHYNALQHNITNYTSSAFRKKQPIIN